MKTVACLFLGAVVAAVVLARPETYQDVDINVEEVMSDVRLWTMYYKCAMDKDKCPPEAKRFKGQIQESLEDYCSRCSESQKVLIKKVIKFLIEKHPDEWKALVAKYDPDNKYSTKYEKELEELKG